MTGAALAAFLSHWRRHPVQLAALIMGLALATGLWSAVQAINSEARASYSRAAGQLGMAGHEVLTAPAGTIDLSTYVELRRAGWQLAPVLEGRWSSGRWTVDLIGIDFLSHPLVPALAALEQQEGRPPLDALLPPGRLFLHPETLPSLQGAPSLPPASLSGQLPRGVVMADIGVVSRLLDRPGQLTKLIVLPQQPAGLPPIADLAPSLVLSRETAGGTNDVSRLTDSFHLNLSAFGLLSFAVGLFIVQGAAGLGLEQRRGLVRTLRALGVPLSVLAGILLAELILIAAVAGGIGLVAGYFVAAALLPDVSATLSGLYGASVGNSLSLRPGWVASGLGMALAGTLLASLQSLLSIWRMPVLVAPATRARSLQARRSHTLGAATGAAMIAAGTIVIWQFDGLVAGFAFLAGLMLGAALMLPLFLSVLIGAGERLPQNALSQWLWADARSQLPGISLSLMALLLALAANIGVGTMVSSFRLTFTGWMDQRFFLELYVTARDDAEGAKLQHWLQQQQARVLPIRWSESTYGGGNLRIYGIVDDESYRQNWPLLAGDSQVWDQVSTGQAALINEQLALRFDLSPGSRIELAPGWEMNVAGIYSDYGNPHGQAVVSMPALLSHDPDVPNRRFGIISSGSGSNLLLKGLREEFDIPRENIIDQTSIKARSMAVFDRTFVVTGALNILTLGVAGFAMLTSLLTHWNQRLPQLAPVWAMGITRRRLARFEVLRSLLLGALTAVLALPLGLVLAWALLAIINVEAFGWRLPMYLFPLDWLRLFLLALAAAAAAAFIPARKLAKLKPSELLGVFANER